MQKNFGLILFFLLNICLTPIVSSLLNFIVLMGTLQENDNSAIWFILLLLLPLKVIIFPFIYEKSNKNYPLFNFLNRFQDGKFSLKILLSILFTEIFIVLVTSICILDFPEQISLQYLKNITETVTLIYLMSLGGLFISYLFFIIFLKIKK